MRVINAVPFQLFLFLFFQIENGTNGGMICMSAFCDAGLPDKQLWMLGGAFLSSVYTTFDLENGRVGIAESNN